MNCKVYCLIVTGVILLGIGITLLVFTVGFQHTKPASPCAGKWGPVTYHHRGNVTFAQENTYDAIVNGSALNGANPEVDVRIVGDGSAVLFHDKSMLRITGVDKNIADADRDEALSTPILEEIDGYNYGFSNSISRLEVVVQAICEVDENIGINFDTKSSGAVVAEVASILNSACTNTVDNIIWSTPYPGVVTAARKELKENGMNNRIAIFMPSGVYGFLGLKFMIKTRILQGLAPGSSIVTFHKTIYDVEQELIQSWVDDGWCTGIYGILPEEVDDYTADYYVVDEGPIFSDLPWGGYGGDDDQPEKTDYKDDSLLSYGILIAVAIVLLLCGIGSFYLAFRCYSGAV